MCLAITLTIVYSAVFFLWIDAKEVDESMFCAYSMIFCLLSFIYQQNVKGMFYLTRACIPLLEASAKEGDPSRIINIGSIAGFVSQEAPTHAYDVSKAAVHSLTRKLAADLAPKRITVNCLAPGYVPSRMSAGLKSWGATEEAVAKSIPLGRMGNDEDMAGACLYFASRAGSWCTGVILNVDGGAIGAMQVPLASL